MARDRLLDAVRDRGKPGRPEFREPDDAEKDIDLDEPDENEDDDSDENEDDDSDDDNVDESKLPDNVRAILKKNRDETRQAKRDLRDARRATEKPKDDDKPADEKPRGPSDREVRIESRLKRTALKAELLGAGVSSSNARLLIGQAKLGDLALDDDDEVDTRDLEDVVEDMKRDFPDLFGKPTREKDPEDDETPAERRRRTRQTGGGGSSRQAPRERGPRQSADALADILTGKTR